MSRTAVEALLNADCSPVEKLVLQAIASHMGRNGTYPSVRRIAQMAVIATSTAQLALESMRKKKWLSWHPRCAGENNTSIYTIHFDTIPMLPTGLWNRTDSRYKNVPIRAKKCTEFR
jgi:hypothetical protein